jgi:hypothetical protein
VNSFARKGEGVDHNLHLTVSPPLHIYFETLSQELSSVVQLSYKIVKECQGFENKTLKFKWGDILARGSGKLTALI